MAILSEEREAPPAAEPLARVRPVPHGRAVGVLTACFLVGLALYWAPLRGVDLAAMNGYGLISVLPIATLVGAFVLVVTFFATLALPRPRRVLLTVQLVALVFALHGLAPALEETARPPTAWQHLGLVEYITRTGEPHVLLDARYSWPGFFAAVGFIAHAAGIEDLEPIMHWSPVGLELLYLAAYYLILRVVWADWRAKWTAAWLLVAADWVGQDYFAPQGLGFALYLLLVGILLNRFMPRTEESAWPPGRGWLSLGPKRGPAPGERPVGRPETGERIAALAVVLGIVVITVATHQLTPYLMLFTVTALVLAGRCTLRGLPVLMAVLTASWIGYMAKAYWEGQSESLFSGIGNLLDILRASVGERITRSSAELATIQQTRVLIAVAMVVLALCGLCRRRLHRLDDRVAAVLLLAPFLAIGLQHYGGEITLRVYLFILPGACLLTAYLFFPAAVPVSRPTRAVGAAAVCGLLVAGSFLFVRFGNENFERVRPGEVQAFHEILRQAPQGRVNLVWQTGRKGPIGAFPQAPWGLSAQERWDYTELQAPRRPENITPILEALRQRPGGFFLTTRSNEEYNHYFFALPKDYAPRLVKALESAPELRPVFRHRDADVFALRVEPGPAPQVAPPAPFSIGRTPWTPVGVPVTVLLVVVLVVREVARIRGRLPRRGARPVLRWLGYAVWPLLALWAFVLIERFHVLGS